MAVRRISDLPNLYNYYQDAKLEDCLIEVSYAKPDPKNIRRYQSFYAHMSNVKDVIVKNIDKASKTQFGIVKIDGNNIDVNDGVISVKTATSNDLGVVKTGNADTTHIQNNDGTISVKTATSNDLGVVKTGNAATTHIQNDNGTISVKTATKDDYGVVKIGNGLTIDDGTINVSINASIVVTSFYNENTGTKIATLDVTTAEGNTSYSIYDSNNQNNNSIGSPFPEYDAGITIPLKGYEQTAATEKYKPTLKLEVPMDSFIVWNKNTKLTLDGSASIGTGVDSNYTLVDSFPSGYGYWASAGKTLFFKGSNKNNQLACIFMYPLKNGQMNEDFNGYHKICTQSNVWSFYQDINNYHAIQTFELQGSNNGSSWNDVTSPNTAYKHYRISMRMKTGWIATVSCVSINSAKDKKTYTATSASKYLKNAQIAYSSTSSTPDQIGTITCKIMNLSEIYEAIVFNSSDSKWYKYGENAQTYNTPLTSDPEWYNL